ncbi:choline dehydrogenase-like flavoprotein [Limnobacter thiooxidans]|uniref:Choline dehydrogenase n=1 Tax=Limnobacter thiooxidans TaxID=131080 RepID=A0AA86J0E0_9BURK|nr:choline dehydrogenase [Limnobacter sp.]MCZ8014519.1 choline dehydrogenase [Limnobacter sp.]RZS41847.1 choline dehydrogenase-like flavoprotein [Limnobacter thiooxidans]BET26718.1 choline dehydrogenase [Limnobacter thiooxidans]
MKTEHDYIVVGGGSGGCAMAGRLSEDSSHDVCLLEAGGDGTGNLINIPSGAVAMLPTKINNWAFETTPQPGLNGRKGYQPRGKCLGGSSAINAMVYVRGTASDYDRWANEEGCSGWSYKEVLPYFKLSECNERIRDAYHGNAGPLNVADLRSDNPFQQIYLEAGKQAGFKITDDFNGADQEGVGIYQVTQKNGERWSAARAYLFPHLHRKNLTVHTKAMVQRVLFEGKRAVAVEVDLNGQRIILRARKEIILTAGAIQTPQLLMVSGVGDMDELARNGIQAVHHLPGVGKNLQDHPDFIFGYSTKSLDTLGLSIRGGFRLLREIFRYRKNRRGALSSNFAEGGAFLKTKPELKDPDVQLHFVVAMVDDHARKMHMGHGFSCHVCLLRPHSRGSLTLQGNSMDKPPLIDIGFLKDPRDLDALVDGFKLTRKIMHAPAMAKWILKDKFTEGVQTDAEIREVLRNRVDTVYHPTGTCKMGTDEMSVVDPQLRVHGLTGLRIVDASVMPSLIGGNTNAPVMMMAEKAVDMIRGVSRVKAIEQAGQLESGRRDQVAQALTPLPV